MRQDAGQLGGREPYVQRHHDGPCHHHTVVAFEQLVSIETQVRDAVAGLDALRFEAGRQPLAAFAELAIRKTLLARDHSLFLSEQVHSPV